MEYTAKPGTTGDAGKTELVRQNESTAITLVFTW